MRLRMPSTLTLVSIISVVMGVIVLTVSAVYVDAVLRLRRSDRFSPFCPADQIPTPPLDFCKITRTWVICATLGILVGFLQIFFGSVGIKLIDRRWKVWVGCHIFLFLVTISVFSWSAKEDVDEGFLDNIANFDLRTQAQGQIFLALTGLDFIYLFAAIIFVVVFARNNSSHS